MKDGHGRCRKKLEALPPSKIIEGIVKGDEDSKGRAGAYEQ